jgi:hypothetical protein
MSDEALRHALERCRAWNIRNGNWSQEIEELVNAALAEPAKIGSHEEEPYRQDRDV